MVGWLGLEGKGHEFIHGTQIELEIVWTQI